MSRIQSLKVGVAALLATALGLSLALWSMAGGAVFFEVLAAGLAACF